MATKKITMSSAADRSLRGINWCWLFFVLVLVLVLVLVVLVVHDGISRLVLVIDR
jgi:hypothetical protein